MKDANRKRMFAEKRSGLNKVTVQRLSRKDEDDPVFQVNVNGKGAFFPSNEASTKLHLDSAIRDAKVFDKKGEKINQ